MSLTLWLAFVAASAVLLIIPGPTILTVISYSLSHGRRANVPLVAAVALGDSTALVVSLLATLLLYRLIARGNLVNVTSLFYLVPAVTAVMDYLIFGNRLAMLSLLGMALIIVGLVFVFRQSR